MTTSPHNESSRFDNSGKKPLYYRDDQDFVRELIWELIKRKRYVRRESKYHIKVRDVNFWPSTGTISIDGEGRHPAKGAQALLALLDERYPKRRGRNEDAEANTSDTSGSSSSSAAPVFWIGLDNSDLPEDYDAIPSDSWDDDALE
ncbi:hypothetical protein [Bradyrhizobium sp. ORS 111]|uniref:hypothetical protein n=1 Tax=Bradyrhizobium sp. ORS 111 TaxID=1685958 RepID=UPI00388F8B02